MSTTELDTVPLHASDGSVADVLVARTPGARHGVLVLPALGIPEGYYAALLTTLAARGLTAAVLGPPRWPAGDARAKPPIYGYADLALDFVPRAIAALGVPAGGLFLVGHSLGGAVGGLHAGTAQDVAGMIFVASGTPYHAAYDGMPRVRTLLGTQLIGVIARLLGYFPGDKLGFGGRMSGKLAQEWSSIARTGALVVTHRSRIDAEATLAQVRCPVLSVVLPGDDLAPERAARHLVEKLGSTDTSVRRYEAPEGHAVPDHNRWPRDPVPFADIVEAFIDSVVSGRSVAASPSFPHVAPASAPARA